MLEGREAEAAAVAARLKAFQANPVRMARLYADGAEPLPEGAIVLRFAQGRIPAALAPSAVEAHQLRRAAELFVKRVCLGERADHYQVLCAPRDAPAEVLKGNYHLLMGLLHPDRQEGAADPWPDECAQRVNLAYAALGDDAARREYDAQARPKQPRRPAAPAARPGPDRAGGRDVRFAKSLIAVSTIVAVVVAASLLLHDDEWSDRSVLQASLARLRIEPLPGADRPRYVGASAMAPSRRANDAVAADEPSSFEILRPIMRAFSSEPAKAYVPPPAAEASTAAVIPATLAAPVAPVSVPAAQPMIVAQAPAPVVQPPRIASPTSPAPTSPVPAATGPSPREIENLVVALVMYYEAGDADRIVEMIDPESIGFFRKSRMRQAYGDFFRATQKRELRIERLAWSTSPGTATAKGEATVRAQYADRAPLDRRVDLQMEIVLRDGHARLRKLALFPDSP